MNSFLSQNAPNLLPIKQNIRVRSTIRQPEKQEIHALKRWIVFVKMPFQSAWTLWTRTASTTWMWCRGTVTLCYYYLNDGDDRRPWGVLLEAWYFKL